MTGERISGSIHKEPDLCLQMHVLEKVHFMSSIIFFPFLLAFSIRFAILPKGKFSDCLSKPAVHLPLQM
jgi:hypothetical protein